MIFTSILTLITAKALPSLNRNIPSIYFTRISAIIFVYAGVLSLNSLHIESIGSGIGIYSGLFQISQLSILLESFLLIIGGLILVSWPILASSCAAAKENHNYNIGLVADATISKSADYSLIVLFSSLGSSLLISSFDLISLYISIELQSFGLYVLATLYRDSETSTKAGLKYFLLGGLSSCIILLGCGIVYSYTGLTNFESIYSIISTSNSLLLNNELSNLGGSYDLIQGLNLGLILIFIGFLFKIAAAPLHNWSPDVYDEVPTIVTTWLTIIPKIAILVVLLELQYYGFTIITNCLASQSAATCEASELLMELTDNYLLNSIFIAYASSSSVLKLLLLISSFLSLLIGTIVGLAQTRIKRLLAYSTISHIGFILLALAINSESSIDSLIFYIVQYTITNLNMFLIILALSYITVMGPAYNSNGLGLDLAIGLRTQANKDIKDIRYISELSGKYLSNPILSISLAICLFSMAGIPPLIGFFSKQFVLYSAIQNGYYFISLIAITVSVISASYYIKIVKVLYSRPSLQDNNSMSEENSKTIRVLDDTTLFSNETNSLLSSFHSYLISVLTLSILFFIFKPSLILNSTQLLSVSLFYW